MNKKNTTPEIILNALTLTIYLHKTILDILSNTFDYAGLIMVVIVLGIYTTYQYLTNPRLQATKLLACIYIATVMIILLTYPTILLSASKYILVGVAINVITSLAQIYYK